MENREPSLVNGEPSPVNGELAVASQQKRAASPKIVNGEPSPVSRRRSQWNTCLLPLTLKVVSVWAARPKRLVSDTRGLGGTTGPRGRRHVRSRDRGK